MGFFNKPRPDETAEEFKLRLERERLEKEKLEQDAKDYENFLETHPTIKKRIKLLEEQREYCKFALRKIRKEVTERLEILDYEDKIRQFNDFERGNGRPIW